MIYKLTLFFFFFLQPNVEDQCDITVQIWEEGSTFCKSTTLLSQKSSPLCCNFPIFAFTYQDKQHSNQVYEENASIGYFF
jgi:hypothetical protein